MRINNLADPAYDGGRVDKPHQKTGPEIYADSEIVRGAAVRNFQIVQTEGSREVSRGSETL